MTLCYFHLTSYKKDPNTKCTESCEVKQSPPPRWTPRLLSESEMRPSVEQGSIDGASLSSTSGPHSTSSAVWWDPQVALWNQTHIHNCPRFHKSLPGGAAGFSSSSVCCWATVCLAHPFLHWELRYQRKKYQKDSLSSRRAAEGSSDFAASVCQPTERSKHLAPGI